LTLANGGLFAFLMSFGPVWAGYYLTASLIGFAAGTAISVLLLVLTLRAAKMPGTPLANTLFAFCALVWNLGGLAGAVAVTLGADEHGALERAFLAIRFTSAAAWPIPLLAVWKPLAFHPWQRKGWALLQSAAAVSCAAITLSLWVACFGDVSDRTLFIVKESTSYNATILLCLGIALFRNRLASGAMRLPLIAILTGAFGTTLSVVVGDAFPNNPAYCTVLHVAGEQSPLLIVIGAFFLFTRFRFSDLFIRYTIRGLLATLTAVAILLLARLPLLVRLEERAAYPEAARALLGTALAVVLLSAFAYLDGISATHIERWIFRAPHYRNLVRQISETLARLQVERDIALAVEDAARGVLGLEDVSALPIEGWPRLHWPEEIFDGEIVELDCRDTLRDSFAVKGVELLVPIRSAARVSHVLAIAPGPARRGLVTHEVDYLRSLAALYGHRLDSLRLERQTVERQSREALLLQQVTEAELRALRAQINPHFLFNSLNSIANLIVTNPKQAEAMTLRLAKVFRYVLANSARSVIPLCEEIEFLETYLQIEEARFGNRLIVNIDVDPAVAMEHIPSLMLQPVVENALKHGLGPKPGQGHLWIAAKAHGNEVRLVVEDDGLGPAPGFLQSTNGRPPALRFSANGQLSGNGHRTGDTRQAYGVGLENIARRLATLYHDDGRITLEPRNAGGTRVTILFPREKGELAL
jgi:two-component system LytT family sensor kinase